MPGEIELHAGQDVFLLEEEPAIELRQVDRRRWLRRGAGRLGPRLSLLKGVYLKAEVVEAVAFGIGVRGFLGAIPADDRDVDVAVREVDLARQLAVAAADLLQPESLLEQLRGREGVFRGDCDMPDSCHAHLLWLRPDRPAAARDQPAFSPHSAPRGECGGS